MTAPFPPLAAPPHDLTLVPAYLRHSAEPGFVLDESWRIAWANDAALQALARPLEGRELLEILDDSERSRVVERLRELEPESGAATVSVRCPDGRVASLTIWREGRARGAWLSLGDSQMNAGLRLLHQIMLRAEQMSDALAMSWLISAVTEFLQMEVGLVARLRGDVLAVEHGYPSEPGATWGTYPVDTSCCGLALAQGRKTTAIANLGPIREEAPRHGGRDAAAYLGRPVVVDGRVYGTVSFSSSSPRQRGFGAHELEIVQLVATWVESRLARRDVQAAQDRRITELDAVVHALPDPVAHTDAAFRIVRVNPPFERLLGYPEAELLGEPIQRFVGVARVAAEVSPGGGRSAMTLRRRSGAEIVRPLCSTPVRDPEGRPIGYLFVVREA